MTHKLDIVGHFGTTFSYATVAAHLAERLMLSGRLGSIANLDPEWHSEHEVLRMHAMACPERSGHVLLVTPPYDYFEMYPQMYGRDRTAIFMSPNSRQLFVDYCKFGLALAPSTWCAHVTSSGLQDHVSDSDTQVDVIPLGVDDSLEETRRGRIERLRNRVRHMPTVVHLSTDQSWPGRKGTEQLLSAWATLPAGFGRLIVHVPPALHLPALRLVRDLEITDSVTVQLGEVRGGDQSDLQALFDQADLLVAPSRCEGFGIMLASSLVAGVPLLTTYETGQRDFLCKLPGWLGVPTDEWGPLVGEVGLAPTLNELALTEHLKVALEPAIRERMLSALAADDVPWEDYTWRRASRATAGLLMQWLDREDRPT